MMTQTENRQQANPQFKRIFTNVHLNIVNYIARFLCMNLYLP